MVLIRSIPYPVGGHWSISPLVYDHPHPFIHPLCPGLPLTSHIHTLPLCLLAATFVHFLVSHLYLLFISACPLSCVLQFICNSFFLLLSFPVVSLLPPSPTCSNSYFFSRLFCPVFLTGRGIYIYTFSSYPFHPPCPPTCAYWSFDGPR